MFIPESDCAKPADPVDGELNCKEFTIGAKKMHTCRPTCDKDKALFSGCTVMKIPLMMTCDADGNFNHKELPEAPAEVLRCSGKIITANVFLVVDKQWRNRQCHIVYYCDI